MPLLIKICGVTTAEDAAMAVAAGADAIGVNLWPGSKRYVTPERARTVLEAVPRGVLKIGVFVDPPDAEEVTWQMQALRLDRAQLHGDERAADFAMFDGARLVRAVRVRDAASFEAAGWNPTLWLYDAFVDGFGGGGVPAPWPLIARHARRPFLLAGGLTPDNVAAGIAATRPDGVDVASGVELRPGVKDAAKVTAFIAAARAAASSVNSSKP
ncbi:MAG TPA: phosphoribosylanthranilate isomerase [Polyangia bacterium]|nr:phosphoribosylanthranilate isomerase [Polyangia bacterium]